MDSCSRVYPVFGIYKGSNEQQSQFYFDGVLNAHGTLFMCGSIDFALAKKSGNPFKAYNRLGSGDVVAFFRGTMIRESDAKEQRIKIDSLYDAMTCPPLHLLPLELAVSPFNSVLLAEAARNGDLACVTQELISGASPDSIGSDGNPALLQAVAKEYGTIISMLVTYGANPAVVNEKGMSAMSLAQNRVPKFVSTLKKSEMQIITWNWIRKSYEAARPW